MSNEVNYVPEPRPSPFTTVPSRAYGPPRRTGGTFSGPVRVTTAQSPRFTVDNGTSEALSITTSGGVQVLKTNAFNWFTATDALTTGSPVVAEFYHVVTGTPGSNVGASLDVRSDTTNAARTLGLRIGVVFTTATTPVTSSARFSIPIAGVLTEVMRLAATGLDLVGGLALLVSSTQVVGARNTGWTTFTGTANKNAGGLDTGTVTTAQLAQVVKSMLDAMILHGLLGS